MNQTKAKLQSDYSKRLLVAVGSTALSAITTELIMLGRLNDHLLGAIVTAAVGGLIAWQTTIGLSARYKQLKQLDVLQKHGPYGTTEYVAPQEAGRQVGDDGNGLNMWRP